MSTEPDARIDLAIDDGVAVLTIHRHGRRNALHWPLWLALGERLDQVLPRCAPHGDVRALVLTGSGGHFCSGMDLKPDNPLVQRILPAIFDADHDAARGVILELKAITRKLLDLPVPTFCAIEGVAAGGGYEVALHCDVLIAAEDASVGLPEVRWGMVPDVGGTTLLARRVGRGRATLAVTTGRMFPAVQALTLGMVDLLCPPGQALDHARAAARDVGRGGPQAVSGALSALRRGLDLPLQDAFALETEAGVAALISGEPREGTMAFAEKRDPDWGRPA